MLTVHLWWDANSGLLHETCNIQQKGIRCKSSSAPSSNMLAYCTARKCAQLTWDRQYRPVSLVSMGMNRAEATLPTLCRAHCCARVSPLWLAGMPYPVMSKVSFSVAPNLCDPPNPHLSKPFIYIETSSDEQCLSWPGNEMTKCLAWQPINEEIMCWTSLLIGECHQYQKGCVAVQLCRRAVLQDAPRQLTRGRMVGYFRRLHLGNNCEIFGFTIQSQGWDQRRYSFSPPNIMSDHQVAFLFAALQYTCI